MHVSMVNYNCHQTVKVYRGTEGQMRKRKGSAAVVDLTRTRSSPTCFVFSCSFFLEQMDGSIRDTLPCNYFSVYWVFTAVLPYSIIKKTEPFILKVYATGCYYILYSITDWILQQRFPSNLPMCQYLVLKALLLDRKAILEECAFNWKEVKWQQVTHK